MLRLSPLETEPLLVTWLALRKMGTSVTIVLPLFTWAPGTIVMALALSVILSPEALEPVPATIPLAEIVPPFAPAFISIDFPITLRSNRKSTRLNSSHTVISYAVFCLRKTHGPRRRTPRAPRRRGCLVGPQHARSE